MIGKKIKFYSSKTELGIQEILKTLKMTPEERISDVVNLIKRVYSLDKRPTKKPLKINFISSNK